MSTVPFPPGYVTYSSVTATTLFAVFEHGNDGGAEIDLREIMWGTDPLQGTENLEFVNTASVTGLTPGTLYYFWGRTHNINGWSEWGLRSHVITKNVPNAPTAPVLSDINTISMKASWASNGSGGSPITGYELGYGLTDDTPSTIVAATSPYTVSNLSPATTYYFWARVRNTYGFGPWSAASSARTIAGVRINVSGVWATAMPYVKDGGVWKLARPYTRVMGVWKETT